MVPRPPRSTLTDTLFPFTTLVRSEALFRAYFTEGVDLSKIDNLTAIAENTGLDKIKIEQLLNSNTGKLEIEMAEKELQDLGITGVPLFIINRSAEHTSEIQSLMRTSYDVFCLKKKQITK